MIDLSRKHRCYRCIWGSHAGSKVVCMFGSCIKINGWRGDRHVTQVVNEETRPSSIMEKQKREA